MTETHATSRPAARTRPAAPVFPPGRYGRRREPRRRGRWLSALLAVAFVAVLGLLTVRLYQRYGDPNYRAQVVSYTEITDSQVVIEFRVTVNRDDPAPGQLAEQVLTVIERVVIANRDWGGLAVETKFQDNEIDMTTYGDKTVMGVLWVEVQYRHHHLDPRNPNPGP